MHYPKDLQKVIKYELNELIEKYKNKEVPFDEATVKYYSELYKNLKKEKK